MLEKVLPSDVYETIKTKVGFRTVNEIRMRAGMPIILNLASGKVYLSSGGTTTKENEAMLASKIMIEDVIFRASECSIYSVNEQIKRGFVVMEGGIRIGLGGNLVSEKGEIKTMNNFTSVNIRLPHEIRNCSVVAFDSIVSCDSVLNTLIISPPACGKTTFLRDIIYQISERNFAYDILVLDERGEIDIDNSLGKFADKICYSSKAIGFENGIRALAPEVIFTDEIGGKDDIDAIFYATKSGVSVVATAHAKSLEELGGKPNFKPLFEQKIFKRFVVLSRRKGAGTFEGLYNENFSRLK